MQLEKRRSNEYRICFESGLFLIFTIQSLVIRNKLQKNERQLQAFVYFYTYCIDIALKLNPILNSQDLNRIFYCMNRATIDSNEKEKKILSPTYSN